MSRVLLFLLSFTFITNNIVISDNETKNKTFIPTKEWQKVEEGQAIPQGLHVRINMHTGVKEAKLYEENEGNMRNKAVSQIPQAKQADNLSPEQLKEIMKNIKGDDADSKFQMKFRSYDELKKDFNELNIQVKTDMEIMKGLMDNFKKFHSKIDKEADEEEILAILVDLEYLVHQYDNAQEFARKNGFTEVIHKSLNSTNADVRSEALRLHGSSTQANPHVQIAALESGGIQLLIKIITFDEDENVKARAMYALSCLLRGFPAAQKKFLGEGGLTAFANIFNKKNHDFTKLKLKIVTLIHDLLFERRDVKFNFVVDSGNVSESEVDDLKEKLSQYEEMNFEQKLVEQGWCGHISQWLLSHTLKDIQGSGEANSHHDAISKIVDTLFVLSDICLSAFHNDLRLIEFLKELHDLYVDIAQQDGSTTNFYSTIANVLKLLTEKLDVTAKVHTEL